MLFGAVLGQKVEVIMPDSVSVERRKLIEQYGAEVILIKDKGDIGECISACKEMSEKMQKENKNIFVPGQFENIANVETHRNYSAMEILKKLMEQFTVFVLVLVLVLGIVQNIEHPKAITTQV